MAYGRASPLFLWRDLAARRKKFRSVVNRPFDLMKFDFSEATKSLHELLRGLLDRLPYIGAALVVFVISS